MPGDALPAEEKAALDLLDQAMSRNTSLKVWIANG
jgi:hypothetical protein